MPNAHWVSCPHCGTQRDISGRYTSPANRKLDAAGWQDDHLSGKCASVPIPHVYPVVAGAAPLPESKGVNGAYLMFFPRTTDAVVRCDTDHGPILLNSGHVYGRGNHHHAEKVAHRHNAEEH